jgi:hypothetical protein
MVSFVVHRNQWWNRVIKTDSHWWSSKRWIGSDINATTTHTHRYDAIAIRKWHEQRFKSKYCIHRYTHEQCWRVCSMGVYVQQWVTVCFLRLSNLVFDTYSIWKRYHSRWINKEKKKLNERKTAHTHCPIENKCRSTDDKLVCECLDGANCT